MDYIEDKGFNFALGNAVKYISRAGRKDANKEIEDLAKEFSLHLIKKINIYGIEGGNLKRNILEFSFAQKPLETIDFTIEESPRKYSEQYLELTKDFHVFRK